MIIPVDDQTCGCQSIDRLVVTANVFAHSVRDLYNAARRREIGPACAGNTQPVRARELKLGDLRIAAVSRHDALLNLLRLARSAPVKLGRTLFEEGGCALLFVV